MFRRIFEQAPLPMFVVGPDGCVLQVNEAYCGMLGYSEQEVLGREWMELIHPDDLENCRQSNEEVWKGTARFVESKCRHMHRGGTVVWTRQKVSLSKDEGGRPLYAVVH